VLCVHVGRRTCVSVWFGCHLPAIVVVAQLSHTPTFSTRRRRALVVPSSAVLPCARRHILIYLRAVRPH
jgi:hypothetical protein